MVQITDKVFAVEVPSMAFGLMVNNYGNESELMYMLSMSDISEDDNSEETLVTKPLPTGTWHFLFATKTATEEQARKVVDRYGKGWKDYNMHHVHKHIPYELAIDSLETLLRSKGLDDNKNYALIEKLSSDECRL